MKPRMLRIKGLNSFVEEQIIDFSKLTEKGLFGIFGPTGSGKSTILDAMTIALYGSIARDTREFMNTHCDALTVSLEFEVIFNGERKIYCSERVFSRDKTGSYKSKHVILVENAESGKVVIAEGVTDVKENIEKILGLTSEDFTRSVVLPQGKFSEFLKLTGKDRRNMLERLFGLERFGRKLGDRIRAKRKAMNDSLNIVIGRIKTYEEQGISEENYKGLKEQLKVLENQREAIRLKKENLDKEYELNKNLWELQLELTEYENKEKKLKEAAEEIEVKKSQLKASQNGWNVKPYIDSLKDTEFKIENCKDKINKISSQLEASNSLLLKKEEGYKYWQEKKENELPGLIQKETNLNRAVEMLNKLKLIEEEREALLKEYSEKNKQLGDINKKVEAITERLASLQSHRQQWELSLEELSIDPSYRDDVNQLAALQEEGKRLTNSINELKQKQQSRNALILSMEKELNNVLLLKNEKFKEIAITEEKVSQIITAPPPDNSVLFEKKDNIFKLEKQIEELKAFKEKKEEITSELMEIDKKLEDLDGQLEKLLKENKIVSEKIDLVEKEITDSQKKHIAYTLAAELKEGEACPVCGSEHHPVLALKENNLLDELTDKKALLIQQQRSSEEALRKLEVDKGLLKKNREYIAAYLVPLENQYKGLEIESATKQKKAAEKEFETISSSIERWTNNKEVLEKQLSEAKESKVTVEQDEIKLTEKLKAERAAFAENSTDIENNERKLQPIVEQINRLKNLYNIEDVDKIQKELRQKEKEGRELQLKLKGVAEEINKLSADKENQMKGKSSLEVDIARILESGKEKRTVIDREKQYVEELSEGKSVYEFIEEVKLKKQELINNETKSKEALENCREENRKLKDSLLQETTTNNSLMLQAAEESKRLTEQIRLYGFEDAANVEGKLLSQEVMGALELEITVFEKDSSSVKANIDRIISKIGDKRLKEEEWQSLITERKDVNSCFENNMKQIAAAIHRIQEMEANLTEYKELQRYKKELEHICSNIDDIAKLVEGNKFVEFVALSQLKYICVEASKRLKNITGGRYALEIDGSGNFVMRDDFNGGARRSTGTLSGGETFLTSLCLALALSSQVQLKGSAPLEFFFLDEGFGTLDNDLLDTVMDSLERLYSDRLCVGIISHVEEIKNRVPIKLVVEPAQHGIRGSRVKMELS